MINIQTLLNSLGLVIITKNQMLTTGVTNILCLRCIVNHMIGSAAAYAGSSAAHTVNNVLIRYIYIDGIIHLLAKLIKSCGQALCLGNRSRKSVQYITIGTIRLLNTINYEITGQFVRHQCALIHISFRFLSKLGSVLDVCAENIACGNMRNSVFLSNLLGLSSFSSPRCS